MNIKYVNHNIEFDNLCDNDRREIKKIWTVVRDSYTDWVSNIHLSDFGLGKPLAELMIWKGMSTWWINPLIRKDTEIENIWLYRIFILFLYKEYNNINLVTDDKLLIKAIRRNFKNPSLKYIKNIRLNLKIRIRRSYKVWCILLIIRSFFNTVLDWATVKICAKEKAKEMHPRVLIRTLFPANWIHNSTEWVDRHFATNFNNCDPDEVSLICYLVRYPKDKKINRIDLIKKIYKFHSKINHKIYFPEAHLNFSDIVKIYMSTFLEWLRFIKWKNNDRFLELFEINSLDCRDILLSEWEFGYFGSSQYSKIHGLSMKRLLEKFIHPQTILTYGEFFVQNRSCYHLVNKLNKINKFVSIQHAQNGRNNGVAYSKRVEYSQDKSKNHIFYSPSPDYYLAQGPQYANLLSEFFPKSKVKIIGCLKHIKKIPTNIDRHKIKIKTILICFGSTDSGLLIKFLKNIKGTESFKIIITFHPSNDATLLRKKIKSQWKNFNYEFETAIPTMKLLPTASLLICGYSNIAYEASIFGVQAVRIIPLGYFPPREGDHRLQEFDNIDAFNEWFALNWNNLDSPDLSDILKNMYYEYYYKNDANSHKRMWNFLSHKKELPHNLKLTNKNYDN